MTERGPATRFAAVDGETRLVNGGRLGGHLPMFTVSAVAPLNPPDEMVTITPEQVWQAMAMRARGEDPRFGAPELTFEVLEDHGDWLTRRIHHEGHGEGTQRISDHANRVQLFEFTTGPQSGSVIVCMLQNDREGADHLRFTWMVQFESAPQGSDAERALEAEARPIMGRQPALVVDVTRQLVLEGRL